MHRLFLAFGEPLGKYLQLACSTSPSTIRHRAKVVAAGEQIRPDRT